MSQINQVPVGLQSLLGSKNFGRNPADLTQAVIPTLELLPFYSQQRMSLAQQELNVTSAGQGISIEVPGNEMWLAYHLTAHVFGVNANEEVSYELSLKDNPGISADYFTLATKTYISQGAASINESDSVEVTFPQPVALGPGWQIYVRNTGFSGTAVFHRVMALYLPLSI